MATFIRTFEALNIFKTPEERVMIFGNDSSGKTTLLYRLKLDELVAAIPTIGFNIETVEHKKRKYVLWDVGGCDKMRPLWRHYVAKDTSIIYLHNVVDERLDESLDGARDAALMMDAVKARVMWIVFNKQDLLPPDRACDVLSEHRKKFEMELLAHAPNVECRFVDLDGFSAATGARCAELLDILYMTTANNSTRLTCNASSATLPQSQQRVGDIPSECELIERIEQERNNDLNGDDFWKSFMNGQVAQWNHRSHLRAGYILVLDALVSSQSIFECAENFLDHLQRLREVAPDRFRNTEHRTMTIFWLYNLQLAILNFKSDKCLEKLPERDLFDEVLLHSPYLMYGGLWKEWYSKELMMSPEAKVYWRLPDLQALPDFAEKTTTRKRHVRRLSQEEPYRLVRFAFAVVQKYLSSNIRRGWLVKQALASLQTTTMRIRAQNPDLQPYSETQAYFWIQMVHAALSGAGDASDKNALANIALERLSFSSFRTLFELDSSAWRKYYTPAKWESVEARAAFVAPDLQPLPNVIGIPSTQSALLAQERQRNAARDEMAAEVPSMEELCLQAAILLEAASRLTAEKYSSVDISSHVHLLRFLHHRLTTHDDSVAPIATKATSAMMEMQGDLAGRLTLKAFWTQQVLVAASSTKTTISFDDMIRANMHLVYADLPCCYYSPELLESLDSKVKVMPPDRRKFKSLLPVAGATEEDSEWIIM